MKKKIILLALAILPCLFLVGCAEHDNDYIVVYNRSTFVFDNVNIPIKYGYFYDRHEKFTVDDNTVAVTIYFSNDGDDSWE